MHTEHIQNVRLVRVLVGWLIAVAIASLVALAFASFGLIAGEAEGGSGWGTVAVVIGFFVGGLIIGLRTTQAPILHGVAMGLLSIVAAFVLNLLAQIAFQSPPYATMSAAAAVTYLLAQVVAAVLGSWSGYVLARRGADLEL